MEKYANHSWNVLRASIPGLRRLSFLFPSAQFFCPVVSHRHFNRRIRKWVTQRELVMPGYAFSHGLHPSDIRGWPIDGVRGFLRDASSNVVEVDYNRTLVPFYRELRKQDRVDLIEEIEPKTIAEGDEVAWKRGTVMQGKIGTVIREHTDGTVTVEIREGGRAISVQSQTDLLEAV